jgi:hypothetical protein
MSAVLTIAGINAMFATHERPGEGGMIGKRIQAHCPIYAGGCRRLSDVNIQKFL